MAAGPWIRQREHPHSEENGLCPIFPILAILGFNPAIGKYIFFLPCYAGPALSLWARWKLWCFRTGWGLWLEAGPLPCHVPDSQSLWPATPMPPAHQAIPRLALAWPAQQLWSAPDSGGNVRCHSEVSWCNYPREMGRLRPARGGDPPRVT